MYQYIGAPSSVRPGYRALVATGRATRRMAGRRLLAFLIDGIGMLGWIAVTAAVGIPLYLAGVIRSVDPLTLNVVAALVVIVPIVVAAAAFESGRRGATPGKRALHLEVRHGVRVPGFARALGRNALKIGVAWIIGHAAVIVLATTGPSGTPTPAVGIVLLGAAYVLPIGYVVGLFAGTGRPLYDRIPGTRVTLVAR